MGMPMRAVSWSGETWRVNLKMSEEEGVADGVASLTVISWALGVEV